MIDGQMMRPDLDSRFLIGHVSLLCSSYRHWTGKCLLPAGFAAAEAVHALHTAPFAVLSHGMHADPVFNYGNRQALDLFEMAWAEFTALPSRLSAEPGAQDARRRLLAEVSERGYSDNYTGVRISKTGRRFLIRDATVWNLIDVDGGYRGQAAVIRAWQALV